VNLGSNGDLARNGFIWGLFWGKFKLMMKPKILLLLFLICGINLCSQSLKTFDRDSVTSTLYQHASDDSPGMAVGIVQDGKVTYEHYLGYANLEHQIKIDGDTRFNIASNAKQFTALCILKLVEDGKIGLEDDCRKYLPDLYKEIQDPITITHLLNHTSGIRDVYDLWALKGLTWWELFIDNGDALELLEAQTALNFTPGTKKLYSNSNYILLAEIIAAVTDQDFSQYAKQVFEKLGMPNTGFLSNYMAIVPHKARPYGNWGGWREYPCITEIHGDGALFTSLTDQLKWEQIIQRKQGKGISRKLIAKSQGPIAGSTETTYGYGLEFDRYGEMNYAYHDGNTGAYNATFLRFPVNNLSIVVLSNNANVPTNYLAWQIADLCIALEKPTPAYPSDPDTIEKLKRMQAVTGIYQGDGEDASVIMITEKDGSLYREMYQRDPVKLIPETGGLFEYETIPGLKMNFTSIGQSEQQFTLYKQTQEPSTFRKLSDLDFDGFDKKELNGRYYNAETETEVILQHREGNTYSLTKDGQELNVALIAKDYLRMMGSYKIKGVRDAENRVVGLSVDNGRIRNVAFERR